MVSVAVELGASVVVMVGCRCWLGWRSTYVAIVVMGTAAIAAIGPKSATSSRLDPCGWIGD